jgi:signal transduction histidine kinase/DNA-binding response OmpR family regulator
LIFVSEGVQMAKILIADDHAQNREYLVDLLRHCGHDLLEAGDGVEALERVLSDHPDLVIADLLMPAMDGYELVRRIRNDVAVAQTPVVFHSAAYDDGEVQPLAAACGVAHILRKPAEPQMVLDLVGQVLGATQRPAPHAYPPVDFDREHLRLLTDKLSQHANALEIANARLNMLIELGTELARDHRAEDLLEYACQSARAVLDAEFAALGVLDDTGREFRHHFVSGGPPEKAAALVSPTPREGFLCETLAGNRPVRLKHCSGALLGVPIVSPSRVYGVLYFIGKLGAHEFCEPDERLGTTIASKVAISYENTIRRDDLESQAAKLRQEVIERQRSEAQVRALNAELEQRVRERTAELSRSNAELEQFAWVAAHDLQEPLRKVVGFTQLLADSYKGRFDAAADTFLSCAVDAAVRMQQLIRELLTYSKVGAKARALRPTDCEEVLARALSSLQVTIEESRAVVTHDPLPTVTADGELLVQVLQNLIGNAVKFRGTETSRVHIHADRRGDEWVLSVRDNGIGIEPRFKERVFVLFQRLHDRTDYPGTGIGLAICKKAIERQGGRLWVDSELGKGATFSFTIPACRDHLETGS